MKTNRTLGCALCLAVVLAAAFASGGPDVVMAEEASTRLISVTGEATMEVAPDMATIRFGVENTADTAQDAQRQNTEKMNAVIDALLSMGIPRSDVQTSNFSLYPVYEWEESKTGSSQELVGYRCNNTVTVRLKDISKAGLSIDTAVTAGATNVGTVAFGLQDPNAHRSTMLTSAVKDARAKADIMAAAAGVTITGVHKMSDGYTSVELNLKSFAGYGDLRATPTIEPGSLTIRASVRIDFAF